MAKENIIISDFDLFTDSMKALVTTVGAAKFTINEAGLAIYGTAEKKIARCELTTNAIYSNNPVEFSLMDLQKFVKILMTVKDIHEGDYSNFKFIYDAPFIKFESKKFKTKLHTDQFEKIESWVSKKIETKMTPVFEFTTTSDMIKRINSHSFIFGGNTDDLRVYLETKADMENNTLFATLGNKSTELNNELTIKCGLVTLGKLEKTIILDLQRLNLFNAIPSDSIKISLMNVNVLVGKQKILGKNDSYFCFDIYCGILKS